MSAWSWVFVGLAGYLGVSVLVAAAMAAILRAVRRDEVEWGPDEPWASAPLQRESAEDAASVPGARVRETDRRIASEPRPALSPLSRRSG